MIPVEVAVLRDILMKIGTTNSEMQATKWAVAIVERLRAEAYLIVDRRDFDAQQSPAPPPTSPQDR